MFTGIKYRTRSVYIVLAMTALLFLPLCSLLYASAERSGKELVYVNDSAITTGDLEKFITGFFLPPDALDLWDEAPEFERRAIKHEALQLMTESKLLLKEAKKTFDDKRIDSQIRERVQEQLDEIKQQTGSHIALMDRMHERGITLKNWKQMQNDNVLINSYLLEKMGETHIRPSEIREYYQRNRTQFKEEKKIYYRVIHIAPTGRETAAELKRRAERIREMALEGYEFRDLTRRYCFDRHEYGEDDGLQVVEVPETHPDWMPPVVMGLQPGEVSELLERGDSFVIAKLKQISPARVRDLDEVQDEISDILTKKHWEEAQRDLVQSLRGKYNVTFTEEGKNLAGRELRNQFF